MKKLNIVLAAMIGLTAASAQADVASSQQQTF